MSSNETPRVLSIVALVLALTALGLSAWATFRPPPEPAAEAAFSSAQQAEAKTATCAAAELVRRGVTQNTNLQSPGGQGDVTGSLAVAANARLSLSGGGQYLLTRMDPATPPELADAVTTFADTLMDIGAAATGGALNTDPDQAARLRAAEAADAQITDICP